MDINIIDYHPLHRDSIRELNEAWLKKHFRVEDSDVVQLGDPEGEILKKGGYVYYAQLDDGSIVGVAALMNVGDSIYELSKMAVDEAFQGKGIGRQLAEHCLNKARSLAARKVILYSNSILKSAIHLYETLGFSEVELGEAHYERADVKMELNLLSEKHRSFGFLNTKFWY